MKRRVVGLIPGLIVALAILPAARAQTILGPILGANHGSLTAAVTGLNFSLSTVTGGTSTTGTVTLSHPAPAGGATVTLSSNNGSLPIPFGPATVTVTAGNTSANFTWYTPVVVTQQTATVTATLNGTASSVLTVNALTVSQHAVGLAWTASTSTNVAGYNIYRSTTSYANAISGSPLYSHTAITVASVCTSPPTPASCSYTDSDNGLFDLLADSTYYYVVTAVDVNGNESSNSTTGQEANGLIP